MPLNPPALASGFLAPGLASTGNVGIGVPKLSLGIAIGVCQFLTVQAKVLTIDVGTAGVGTTFIPLVVPSPLLMTSITSGLVGAKLLGTMAPKMIVGLANGLSMGFVALALMQINHPTVGVGAGVARILGPSAVPAMISGFASAGLVGDGPTKFARAIGIGLDMTFASFVQPAVPIVGPPSPIPSTGVGLGVVI